MTAIDLLHKILDYYRFWNSPENVNSKPSQSRMLQIETLLKGFGISKSNLNPGYKMLYSFSGEEKTLTRAEFIKTQTNLSYFSSGEFINDRPKDDYSHLLLQITSVIKTIHPEWSNLIDEKPVNLSWLFSNLLQFRQGIYNIAYPDGGMLEGFSTGLEYSFYLQKKFKEIILSNLSEIDETLSLLIDPGEKNINKEDIDYPELDLETIDRNWRMENY
jgi:hypothetical protein